MRGDRRRVRIPAPAGRRDGSMRRCPGSADPSRRRQLGRPALRGGRTARGGEQTAAGGGGLTGEGDVGEEAVAAARGPAGRVVTAGRGQVREVGLARPAGAAANPRPRTGGMRVGGRAGVRSGRFGLRGGSVAGLVAVGAAARGGRAAAGRGGAGGGARCHRTGRQTQSEGGGQQTPAACVRATHRSGVGAGCHGGPNLGDRWRRRSSLARRRGDGSRRRPTRAPGGRPAPGRAARRWSPCRSPG